MHVVNNFWFFSKHLHGPIVNDVAFAWSLVGRIGLQMCRAVTKRDPRYVLGTFDGFVDVLRNRQPQAVRDRSPDARCGEGARDAPPRRLPGTNRDVDMECRDAD